MKRSYRIGTNRPCLRWLALISFITLGIFLLTTFLWLLGHPQPLRAAGPYHYVAPNGTDSGNCSISTPCRTIQQAVANAASGDEIRVATGYYTGTVTLNKNLTLRGGFTTTNWVTPDPDQNPTTLDAQSSGRVLEVSNGISATVSGFRLTGGSSTGHGAGVYNEGVLTLADDRIYGNVTASGADGGGVSSGASGVAATLILRNSQIYSNTAAHYGGGLNVILGTALIEATEIFSNSAALAAGGIAILGGDVTVRSSLIYSNRVYSNTASGGGIGVSDGLVRLENSTIYGNDAASLGGGIYAYSGTTAITNTLLISNTAVSGGGIYSATSGLSVNFSDFFGNSPDHIADSGGPIDPTTLGSSNRITNPLFVDPPNFDLHLSSGSPAIDSGAITTTATIDYEGEGRPFGAGMDRGADEYTGLSLCYARLDYGQVYTNVQAAVNAASSGSLVQVAGYCTGTVSITKSLTLRGGYTVTNWTQPGYGPTILDAQGLGRVIYVTSTGAITPLIENLHITGGRADYGAGVYLGANANATLQNNVIYHNEATQGGGGVYNDGSGNPLLQHNTIYSNTANLGGGVFADTKGSGVVTVRSTIVAYNAATSGGGVYNPDGQARFVLSFNDFYSNAGGDYVGASSTTDISVPPGFVDPTGGDFHLALTSAVINAADPASSLSTDFEGDSRPQGMRSDIGADESLWFAEVDLGDAPESPWIVTDIESVKGTLITFTHAITNTGYTSALTDTFDLTWTNSDGWDVTLVGVSSPVVLTTNVPLNFAVVVSVPTTITEPLYNRTVITATSQTNPAAFDTATDIIVAPGVELAPSYTENADPGEVITYTHTLTNLGPLDVFTITVDSPLGWLQWYTPTGPITLDNLETALIFVQVRVTDTAPAGLMDVMHVWASSMSYPSVSAVVTDTTIANPTTGPRYVATTGHNTNNNCKVKGSPCATIGYAVGQAAWGDPILVAQGTYNEASIYINQNLSLLGGYSSDFENRTVAPANTIINAQNGGRGLHINVPAGFRPKVEGFTIRNGATSGVGGGIYVQASSAPTLTQLIIENSTATRGGGIYLDTGNPVLQDMTISGAVASAQGGGIYINGGSPLLQNIAISGTTATHGGGIYKASGNVLAQRLWISDTVASEQGGGIYQLGGTLTVSQTRVYSSVAGVGGGFYNSGGSLTLWNNFIYSNTATTGGGGGVYNRGTLNLVNDTLYGNRAATFGGGVFDYQSSALAISNTIIVASQAITGGGIYRNSSGSLAIDYNNVWNNTAASFPDSNVPTGAHSISADPLFVDAAAGDLHLLFNSPSVDTAAPDTFLTSDIDGDLRPVNQGFDMGADEVSGCLARVVNPGTGEQVGPLYGVVQDAVDAAPQDYLVQISGICRGVQSRLVNGQEISQTVLISKSLRLAGGYSSKFEYTGETTTLDAMGQGRVVVITDSAFVNISHLTLTGGDAAGLGGGPGGGHAGGGVYNYASFLTLQSSVITGNQAVYGGGLYHVNGTLTLGGDEEAERTYVLSNTATYGGGAYLSGGSPVIGHVTFERNAATQGGGLYNAGGSPTISQTFLYSNTASTGGGIYNASGLLRAELITVAYNSATTTGGGFYNDSSGQLSLQRSVALSNTASTSGGGLHNTGALTVVNTIVAGNTVASGNGGGLYNQSADLTLRHDTFYANSASGQGGGIYHDATSSSPIINSTLIVSNTAGSGGTGIHSAGANPAFDYNDVYGNTSSGVSGVGNISADPSFISTDPASGSFLRIPGGSPAEDKADPNSPVSNDIDGDPRPSNQSFDIGADEVGGCYVRNQRLGIVYGSIQVAVGQSQDNDLLQVAGICRGVNAFVDGGQTVSQTVFLTKTLTIQGGYTVTDWNLPPEPVTNTTVLDALGLGRVVYITNSAVVTISGLHLRQGSAVNGGAVFAGSGVLTMTGNWIYSNTATSNGGAVYNIGGQVTLDSNDLRNNQAASGGAFYHASGTSLVQNNIIRNNQAANGGAIYNNATALTVRHNTVYANSATNGGGFYTTNSSPTLVNNIFANNTATTGHAIYSGVFYNPDYNDTYPASGAYGGSASPGGHSLAVDPRFVDAAGGDFHLQDDSPVIDRGDPTMTLFHDFEGDLRPGNQGFDMGADEIPGCRARIVRTGVIYGSVQWAIDHSIPGDVIQVTSDRECRGVHPFNTGSRIISQTVHITHSLTLIGGYDSTFGSVISQTTLNPVAQGRAMLITGTAVVTVSNFLLTNGAAAGLGGGPGGGDAGGGLYYRGSGGFITHTTFYSNTAAYGGGLFNAGSGLTLTNSAVWNNTATSYGGGIYNDSDAMGLVGNEIYQNLAQRGGGIYNNTGPMTLQTNEVHHNNAVSGGNGLGGGFYNANSASTLDLGNRFHDNYSDQDGGAIYNNGGNLSLWNTLIYNNAAVSEGGGLYDNGNASSVLHNTFYQNAATGGTARGGGIYIVSGRNPTIKNNIFDSNTAPNGSAIYGTSGTLDYNDYYNNQVEGGVGAGSHSLYVNPELADPANEDFHLESDSPLIDAGEELGVPHDFEDEPRPINTAPDIGADEYNACLAQLVRTGQIYGRIGNALADAISGDVIRVAEGVCEESLTINKSVTIQGSWRKDFQGFLGDPELGVIYTVIEATSGRVITATGGNSIDLSWVRLRNGNAGNGGGIWSSANDLKLAYVSVVSNTATTGGGVYVDSGTANLNKVSIRDNTASGNGGGLYVNGSATVQLMDTDIRDNNAVSGNGGGLYIATGGNVDDSGWSILRNTAGNNGGGVYNDNATYTVRNKWINYNEATGGSGGGVYVTGGSSVLDLTNVLFEENTAHNDGGGLYRTGSGSAALYHNTIYQNGAQTGRGGGVYNGGSSMVISASIVADNTSSSGGSGVHGDATVNVAYTLRWNNTYSGVTEGAGNMVGDPRFLYGWGAYLSYSSPAIDAVPTSASHVEGDAYLDPRPQLCAKDMGLDEYAVGVRATIWITGGPFPQQSATLTPTSSFTYTFPLRNDSENWLRLSDPDTSLGPGTGYTETITVTLNSSKGWAEIVGIVGGANAVIQPGGQAASFAIGPGQVVSIEVRVTVPPGAYATVPDDPSTKELTSLSYQARQCPGGPSIGGTSYQAETWVEEDRNFIIAPDNFGAALPGQTVTYTHIITNLGNITDTYTIVPKNGFYGSGQIAQPESGQITLGPLQTSTVVISVTISAAAAGGLPIPDTTSVIAIASDATQKSAGNNTVISYTTGTRYVSLNGDDSVVDESELTGENYKDNNCTQPLVGACRTIQQAIDQAAPGDLIKIDQGVYTDLVTVTYKSRVITQTAFVNESVILQGGYDRNNWGEDPPSHISHTTTLDPQGQGRAIYVTEDVTATVARLTIANGSAAGSGGGPGGEDAGGNIYNEGGNLTLIANRIQDNDPSADIGGGLYHDGGDLLLQNNLLHGSQVSSQGGAVYIHTGNATLQNNTFYDNAAGQEGGAVYVEGGHFVVTNTIFVSNTAATTGGAIYVSSATAALDYNLYNGNAPNDYSPAPTPGLHNVFGDPQFVDPGTSPPDLHLRSNSPALDVGDPATDLNIDYDNDFRPLGFGYDIGADERVPVRDLWFYPDYVTDTQVSTVLVFTHTLENRGDITETVTLTSTSTQDWAITFAPSLPYTVTLGVGESISVTVIITVPLDANGLTNVTTITATSTLTPVLVATVQDTVHVMSAEWEISKAVTPSTTVQPGGYLTYTLTITNSGDLATSGTYTITDELPDHTHFVTASPAPVLTDPVTWVSSEVISAGQAITRTFVVTVSWPLTHGTPIVNQTYGVVGGGAYTQAVGLPVTVTVDAPASLSITKTVSANPVQPGDYLTYTLTITNATSALGPALDVLVSDTLPANVVYQSMGFVPPATGTVTPTGAPLLLWHLADPIAVGGSAQVTAAVRVTSPLAAGTILTNAYGVTATNSVYVSGTIATPVTSTNSITLSKAVEPTRVTPGETVTYTITLTNTGNGVATVALTDVLDSAFSPPTYLTNVTVPGRTWDTIEGVATVSFTATAPASVGIYYNQWVTATYDLTRTAISHVAPVTVRTCWVRLNDEPTIYDTVQAGVDASTQPTDVVKVAGYCAGVEAREGVIQTVYISKTLTVRGGYTTTNWTTPDPVANPTTLDALGGGRVVYITGDISATIEGLRITGGNAGSDSGGGVYVITATAAIRDNQVFSNTAEYGSGMYIITSTATISNNQVFSNTSAADGGGLYLRSSDATLSGNTVISNTAYGTSYGGGLCLVNSDATLNNNTFMSNTAHGGGGLVLAFSEATLYDNTISHNAADGGGGLDLVASNATLSGNIVISNTAYFWGGGLYLDQDSNATLINNVVADNQAGSQGSGLYIRGSSPHLLHTTIARNSGGDGSGMYVTGYKEEVEYYSTVALTNTILVSHTVGIYATDTSTVTLESTLWGSGAWANVTDTDGPGAIFTGTHNYWGDPAFVDPGAGNYHLGSGSAAIDTGLAAGIVVDIDGQSRPIGEGYDLGADEFPATLGITKEADQVILSGSNVTFTISLTNTGIVTLTGVAVTDALAPDCARTIGYLDVGGNTSYTCTAFSVTADLTNTATVTGLSSAGTVTDTDTAFVDVISPSIQIAKTPDTQPVQSGGTVTFTITVTNTGDVTLSPITITDALVPECDGDFDSLAPTESTSYTCQVTNVTADFTNTVVVTGTSPVGAVVTDTDTAFVYVITPSIQIAKTPDSQPVRSGGTVTFTITITNTGDAPLSPITVTDALVPNCNWTGSLGVGISTTYTCTQAGVTADFTNTVVVTGTPPVGAVVTDTDTAFVYVITPSIQIAKTPDSQPVRSGDTVTFTITITNTGDAPLSPITVTDALVPNCNWTGSLGVGISTTYACTRPNVTADFTNTVVVTGTPPVGDVVTDTDTAFVYLITPTIEIAKTPDTQPVRSGGTVTFTITITNTGDVTLSPITITDALLPECDGDFDSLAPTESTSYTCQVTNVTADFTNTVVVTGTPPVGAVVTDTDTAFVYVITPSIQIAKTPDSQPVRSGDTVTFTITITNTGDAPLSPITVTDALVPNCNWTGSLGVGISTTYACTRPNVTADFTNTVVVTGTPPVGDVVTDTDTAFVDVISPSIEIAKTPDTQTVQSGDTVTFTISVTNTGDADLTNVTVTDAQAPNCGANLGSLSVGISTAYTCTLANVTADLTNVAVVTGTPPVGAVVTDTDTAFVNVVNAAIEIAKTPDMQMVYSGSTVTFTISVTNTGDLTLTNVTVSDAVAPACEASLGSLTPTESTAYTCTILSVTADLTNTATVTGTPPVGPEVSDSDTAFVDVISPSIEIAKTPDSQTVQNGSPVTFTITITNAGDVTLSPITVTDALVPSCGWTGSLGAGNGTTYTCTLPNATADFTNTAVATGTPPVGAVVTDTDTAFVDVITPSIQIAKTPDSQVVQSGDTVTFTITVTNTGDANLTNVAVTDVLAPNCAQTIGSLNVGISTTYACTVTAETTLDFTNIATVNGTPPVGPDVTDSDTAFVDVINPAIAMAKTPDSQVVVSGSDVTFTISITNTGDVTLTNVTVSDVVAPACEQTFASLTPTESTAYTCTVLNVTADLTNTAVVTGTPPVGAVVTDTDTATVTVEEAIAGLVATNDSPTLLGSATSLTATITAGTHVVYTWYLGYDAAYGSGAVVTHTYPAVGVYTAVVTASNSVSVLTATTTVTITDVPITGLVATNDSPTPLGRVTTLTATITTGTNVTYTWYLGYDAAYGSGATVAHTYPATGTYTAVVTASNSVSVLTATTIVSITEPAGGQIYLPIIFKNYTPPPPPSGPDLVVTDISVVPNPPGAGQAATVYVTVRNQGNRAVTYGNNFYVDFYVDRVPAPLLVGDIEWGAQGSWFGIGQSYTFSGTYTFTVGTHQLYAQADTDNTVVEAYENNNVRGPVPLNVTGLGSGEAPVGPAVIPTPGTGGPRPTPTLKP